MKKRLWIVVLVIAVLGLITVLSDLIPEIQARGFGGVNYGGVFFPVLLGVWAWVRLRREKSGEDKKEGTE